MRGSDDGSASASSWRRCAANNTVVATVASRAFAPALLELGGSAARVGFPCVLVLPMDDGLLPLPTPPTLQLLPVPTPSLLPRQQWCNTNANKYGHRRAQLHRVRLWRMVLAAGLDLLAVDAPLRFAASPLPHFHLLVSSPAGRHVELLGAQPGCESTARIEPTAPPPRARSSSRQLPPGPLAPCPPCPPLLRLLRAPPPRARSPCRPALSRLAHAAPLSCGGADASWFGLRGREVGLRGPVWLRSTASMRALTRLVENRTFGGFDQLILNEELNFSPRFANVSCCHTPCLAALFEHKTARVDKGEASRQELRCRDEAPPAEPPPPTTRLRWPQPWRPDADNMADSLRFLRLGRCTAKENSCELSGRPTGGGSAAACLHKHRRYEPGRPKGASPAAVVSSLVAKLTPTLLPAG